MIYLVPTHLLWIRQCKGPKGERKDQQKTTAQQLVASIQQYSTVSCRHGQIDHTDQSRWNRGRVLREWQWQWQPSPLLQYMFGHAIQFWGYLPLYFIPSLPIHDTRSEFQGSIYSIHAWLVSLLIKMFKWREIILQHPVSSSTRVQPMEPPNGRNIYPDMRHGFYAIVLHSCHNFIPYACMNQYA